MTLRCIHCNCSRSTKWILKSCGSTCYSCDGERKESRHDDIFPSAVYSSSLRIPRKNKFKIYIGQLGSRVVFRDRVVFRTRGYEYALMQKLRKDDARTDVSEREDLENLLVKLRGAFTTEDEIESQNFLRFLRKKYEKNGTFNTN